MSDENPSGKPPRSPAGSDVEDAPESAPKSSHKVLADIHSGIVMVALVTTTCDDVAEGDSEDDVQGEGGIRGDRDRKN